MEQQIRPANLQDVDAISRIHAVTWKEAYRGLLPADYLGQVSHKRWLPVFTEIISSRSHTVAVYEHEAGISGIGGCITFGPARDEQMAEYAEITAIYVLPHLWRLGLGEQLMRHALDNLRHDYYYGCYLWVLKGNQRACSFYEKMGFSLSCDEKFFNHEGQILHELRYYLDFQGGATIG